MTKIWLIYIRKSVVRDDTDLESPERQLYVCRQRLSLLAEPYDTEIYQDLDRSGSSEDGRPAWLELKQQLDRPDVAGIIASSLDRLYRNVSEFLEFLAQIETSGKALITAKENLDTTSPLGRFVVTILMALFEMEWRLTSHRMTEMIAYKRREQGRHWGPAPFGTERNDAGQLVPSAVTDPAGRHLHDALTELFRLFSSGKYSYESLATTLNAAGWHYHDRWGQFKPFSHQNIREILARWRLYRGDLPLGNPRKGRNIEWLSGGHDPILPVELCDAVGAQLADRNKPYNRSGITRRKYILTGVANCAVCGAPLRGQPYRSNYLYRHAAAKTDCPQKWTNAPLIEASLIDMLIDFARNEEMLAGIRAKARTLVTPPQPAATDRAGQLRARLDRLENMYIDGDIEREAYLTKRGRILSDLASLDLAQRPTIEAAYIDNIAASLHLIHHATPGTQQQLIASLFTSIGIADDQIKTATPQPWARPFFTLSIGWAGWESSPDNTKPILLDLLVMEYN